MRFALSHATGQGQAVVTLKSPRPHVRAALAVESLDLNPFLAANGAPGAGRKARQSPLHPRAKDRDRASSHRQAS